MSINDRGGRHPSKEGIPMDTNAITNKALKMYGKGVKDVWLTNIAQDSRELKAGLGISFAFASWSRVLGRGPTFISAQSPTGLGARIKMTNISSWVDIHEKRVQRCVYPWPGDERSRRK
ncbi:hypothetical protein CDAR_273771 [Caerostris darwini]|uniref:Uncharacterized protein n=1 Tax=Caerostris darwini TaxID=1538125 RepID=A0AAV4RB64_9ARAC|nr:hypothetical protein CDAR_273771 [Caerostris darwini]